jgi:hypothetical protein
MDHAREGRLEEEEEEGTEGFLLLCWMGFVVEGGSRMEGNDRGDRDGSSRVELELCLCFASFWRELPRLRC